MRHKGFNITEYRQLMVDFIGEGQESQVFWDALDFAAEAHDDQWRRSGDAYIMHPCSVARILASELDIYSGEILAAALLHDTVEDVEYVTTELVRKKFGSNVATIVDGCTKVTNYSGSKQSFKQLVHRKIFSGAAAKPEVMVVKLADRLHNLRTLSSMPHHKRQKIADETLNVYAPLATILGLFAVKRELYNLALAYKFPRQGSKLQIKINRFRYDPEIISIIGRLQSSLDGEGVVGVVRLRTKGLWAYYDVKNRILLKDIENPQEIMITAETRGECYRALGTINILYPPVPRTLRDFIANPKPTGYQGLHARANIEGREYLFKIRTEEMGRRAERGLVRDWTSGEKSGSRFVQQIQEMFDIFGSEESLSYRDMIVAGGRKEIYTYTPRGDLICLPVKSRVLDFAFRVHTDIGHTCTGAMISKKKYGNDHVLKDGDVVKILRQDTPIRFEQGDLKLCQTPKARSELAKAFRQRWEIASGKIGKNILRQEMRRYGVPFEVIEKKEMDDLLVYFNLDSVEDLFMKIGDGRVRLIELMYEVKMGLYAGRETLYLPTGIFNGIELSTLDPVVVKCSACCRPTPFDKGIIGLLSERGLSLHKKECRRLQMIKFQREDAVEVRWNLRQTRVDKLQKIIFMAVPRSRLFMILSVAPESIKMIDVVALNVATAAPTAWEVNFSAADLYELKKVLKHFDRSGLVFEFSLEQ